MFSALRCAFFLKVNNCVQDLFRDRGGNGSNLYGNGVGLEVFLLAMEVSSVGME